MNKYSLDKSEFGRPFPSLAFAREPVLVLIENQDRGMRVFGEVALDRVLIGNPQRSW